MKNSNFRLILMLLPLCFIQPAQSYYVFQRDWSGGPGVLGPVTAYWSISFQSHYNMNWEALPGELFLTISGTQHAISNNLPSADFAFPVDMDGDGDMDAVSSSQYDYRIVWFENDGTGGGWTEHVVIDAGIFGCVYPGDIDLDGDIDLIGANKASGGRGIEWFRNDDGVGDSWTRFRIAYWGMPVFVCCTDIDGDDTLEVVAPSWIDPHQITWWESTTWPPDTSWTSHVVSGGVDKGRELYPIDLDQDGDMDIVSADQSSYGVKWFENLDGVGLSWDSHQIGAYQDIARSAHAADIDGDGDIDVVMCCSDIGGQLLVWYENRDSIGTDWQRQVLSSDLSYPRGVHAADMTGDGFTDIILALHQTSTAKRIYLYRNVDGSGDQWARFQVAYGSWFEDLDVADFNGDEEPDILAAASVGAYVSWVELEGHTAGWLESSILDVNSYPQWDSITWVAEEPPGTDIFFQIRTSNDWQDMGAWCDTIFEPQSLDFGTDRYIQYRVWMTSDTEFVSPVLDEVRFYWTYLGIEGDVNPEDFMVSAYPNPSTGSVTIGIPAGFTPDAEILVYDLAGNLVRRFADLETNVIPWDCDDESGDQVPSGMYLIQAISGDQVRTMRLVRL